MLLKIHIFVNIRPRVCKNMVQSRCYLILEVVAVCPVSLVTLYLCQFVRYVLVAC